MERYPIPAEETQTVNVVGNSRFIATVSPAFSVDEARIFISRIRSEFSDATHNVPAFVIGHGASVTSHCSDDGEPSGTAGRPVLSVLHGSGFGDIVIVVTRYFGGTKLGTGGLVRAYSGAVKSALANLPKAIRVPTYTIMIASPYNRFDVIRNLIKLHKGIITDQDFSVEVTITAKFDVLDYPYFQSAVQEATHGKIEGLIIKTSEEIIPIQKNPNN